MYILDRIKAFALSQDAASLPTTRNLVAAIEQARVNQKLDLLDIEPLELARQLTLLESSLYQKIRRAECLERAQQNRSMDGIGTVIQTSNRIADWVANSVMSSDTPHHRATIVKHLISVADHCRILNNFSTMTAISAGLNTPSIQRLKQTWDRVEKQYMDQFSACHGNTDFEKYRLMLESIVPPCVPFIGSFLMALPVFRDGPFV
ncbi:hypothetical protein MPER_04927 [Moniliophthora perniciosa FA553]|nr:hypothetical protein MPER_04927 [Moniliophthora perniciosa FA553]